MVRALFHLKDYEEIEVHDLAVCIQAEVDRQLGRPISEARFKSIPDRPYNDMRYLIGIEKANVELGWKPNIPFEEGRHTNLQFWTFNARIHEMLGTSETFL